MKLTEMIADLENRIARKTKPWMRIVAGIVLLAVLGVLIYQQVTSPIQIAKRHAKASDKFGEALLKAGIETQLGPSK